MVIGADALAVPWRTLIDCAVFVPWSMELTTSSGARCIWTSSEHEFARAKRERVACFSRDEARLICAAAELDRLWASGFERLVQVSPLATRALAWSDVSGGAAGVMPEHADRGLSLGWALGRLGAEMVRLDVVERGGGA